MREEPRDYNCPHYVECLDKAARFNIKLNCKKCNREHKVTINIEKKALSMEIDKEKIAKIEEEKKAGNLSKPRTKVCKKYGPPHERPLTDFAKNAAIPDGYERACKRCMKKYREERKKKKTADKMDPARPKTNPLPQETIRLEAELIQGVRKALRKEFGEELIGLIREKFLQ